MRSQQAVQPNRQNHFSNQLCTRHQSINQSACPSQQKRKSASSVKKYTDFDKLIGEVKITPVKNSQYHQHVNNIRIGLEGLKELPAIADQIRTIELLVNSLSKKINFDHLGQSRSNIAKSIQKEMNGRTSGYKAGSVSPIKQFDQLSSQIVYTNFSIKEISSHNDSIQLSVPHQRSIMEVNDLETPVKRAIFSQDESQEIQRINSQIKMLEKILKTKGIDERINSRQHLANYNHSIQGGNSVSSSNKTKYMQSENLCPAFRKTSEVLSSHQKITTTLASHRKSSKGINLR